MKLKKQVCRCSSRKSLIIFNNEVKPLYNCFIKLQYSYSYLWKFIKVAKKWRREMPCAFSSATALSHIWTTVKLREKKHFVSSSYTFSSVNAECQRDFEWPMNIMQQHRQPLFKQKKRSNFNLHATMLLYRFLSRLIGWFECSYMQLYPLLPFWIS